MGSFNYCYECKDYRWDGHQCYEHYQVRFADEDVNQNREVPGPDEEGAAAKFVEEDDEDERSFASRQEDVSVIVTNPEGEERNYVVKTGFEPYYRAEEE